MINIFRNKAFVYLIVGGINTLVNLCIYYILLKCGVNYIVDNIICFIIGVLMGYIMNTLIVFKNRLRFKSLLKYSSIYICSMVINIGLLFSFVNFLQVDKMLAQIMTVGVVTIINYLLIKRFVYA